MPTDYLIEHNIEIYMKDALFLLLKYRRKNPSVVANQFFSDYFRTVKSGNHVLYRNFEYINSTAYNRKCFIKLWWEILQPLAKSNDLFSVNEISSLTSLLSPEFPVEIITASYEFCSTDNVTGLTFEEFGCRFQFYLIYQEFLHQLSDECRHLEETQNIERDKESSKISFSTMDWIRIINKFRLRTENILLPSLIEMKQVISNHSSLSLQEFIFHMVNSNFIIEEIGLVKSTNSASKASNDIPDNATEQISESTKALISKNSKCLTGPTININTKKSKLNISSFKPKSAVIPKKDFQNSKGMKSSIVIKNIKAPSLIETICNNDEDDEDVDDDEESNSSSISSTDESTEN